MQLWSRNYENLHDSYLVESIKWDVYWRGLNASRATKKKCCLNLFDSNFAFFPRYFIWLALKLGYCKEKKT
mgnify:CR=1 FL=1